MLVGRSGTRYGPIMDEAGLWVRKLRVRWDGEKVQLG